MSSDPSPPDRSYALRGLTSRDALVFKSMVRLLAGKTRDRWTCVDGDLADLLVVAGDAPVQAARRSDAVRPGTQVIRIESPGRRPGPEALTLPLRADEVCLQLDRAGERIAASPRHAAIGVRRLQLIRWPSTLLLHANPGHLRLATIAGTQPITLEELAEKSGAPLAACDRFAALMHGNGMARWIIDAASPESPPATDAAAGHAEGQEGESAGLLSRIRSRLSL